MSTLFPQSQGTSRKRTAVEHAMVLTLRQQKDILLYAINDVNSSTL